ncbi:hypothetical protein [Paenibacillus sp. NPDC058071]|uniref:hypothetical protein n=1 Tax=Paenibacillus sp. NPDC058071 TaxID=3346326 RepID=UPI0036D77491
MFDNIIEVLPEIGKAFGETLYMLFITVGFAVVLGIPLGTLLYYNDARAIVRRRH